MDERSGRPCSRPGRPPDRDVRVRAISATLAKDSQAREGAWKARCAPPPPAAHSNKKAALCSGILRHFVHDEAGGETMQKISFSPRAPAGRALVPLCNLRSREKH